MEAGLEERWENILGADVVEYLGEELVEVAVLSALADGGKGGLAGEEGAPEEGEVSGSKGVWLGDKITFTCTQQVADWIAHLHHASSLEALPNMSVVIGDPLPQLPHVTHSPVDTDLIAAQVHQVSTAEEAEVAILEMYAEEVELDTLAQAVHEVAKGEEPGRLPRQEVAG